MSEKYQRFLSRQFESAQLMKSDHERRARERKVELAEEFAKPYGPGFGSTGALFADVEEVEMARLYDEAAAIWDRLRRGASYRRVLEGLRVEKLKREEAFRGVCKEISEVYSRGGTPEDLVGWSVMKCRITVLGGVLETLETYEEEFSGEAVSGCARSDGPILDSL